MKVLCSLFPLGSAAYGTRTNAGISRAVEQLCHGLAATDECETTFCTTDYLWQGRRYFEEHLRTAHTRFALTPWRTSAARHLSSLEKIVFDTLPSRAFHLRLLRFSFLRYVEQLNRLIGRLDDRVLEQTDIFHSPFFPISSQVKRHAHVRRFTTVYDVIAISHPQFFPPGTARVIRNVVDRLDADDYVFCISEATRVALLEASRRLNPARVLVTPLAAGPAFHPETDPGKLAAARARVGLPIGAPYFLSVCTFEPRKNLDSVIRAFALLKGGGRINRETHLVLVGNVGWKTEKITAALEEAREWQEFIRLPGFVADEDLAALYSGAQAFVYMSWMEGFGLPPLEAMQCGVPVICADTSSLPEVVGDAGILLPPNDLDGLATAMYTLATDEALRLDLATRARKRAELFSWERFVRQTLDGYRAALRER